MALPNGNAAHEPIDISSQTVVGINFGNSYASIAVLTKDGQAECIANEDGERQIACAISFHGEEMYIGNQAKPQLVKNAQNTITGFRNLLGKKFSEIPQSSLTLSAVPIQHPTLSDTPAYKVKVLQPSPSPLPVSTVTSKTATPAASVAPTPRSEPIEVERILTPREATSIFLRSLIQSAEDFLGKKVDGAVITTPDWFTPAQREALAGAAEDAGVKVMQLLEDAAAAMVLTTADTPEVEQALADGLLQDRNQLIVDLGASALSLSLLSIRQGLAYTLAHSSDSSVGGDAIDSRIASFFAKDFTKKTKIALALPASNPADQRAEAKLRLALEHTKRTISASPGAATCSVESLKEGYDYTGTINRLRFDMEVRPIYDAVRSAVRSLLEQAGVDPLHVDEIVYIGGSASLPGLEEALAELFPEEDESNAGARSVAAGDPTTVLARGCALQAKLLTSILGPEDVALLAAFAPTSELRNVQATTRSVGMIFPEDAPVDGGLGGQWIPGVMKHTPVPCRRIYAFDVDLGAGSETGDKKVGFEIWEAKEGVKSEMVKAPKVPLSDDEDGADEEEDDEEEVRSKTLERETHLASLSLLAKEARKEAGRWKAKVEVQFLVTADGAVSVTLWEVGRAGRAESSSVSIPAPTVSAT